jgi:hypothetical protein
MSKRAYELIKSLFQTIINRKYVGQMFGYPDAAIGFI